MNEVETTTLRDAFPPSEAVSPGLCTGKSPPAPGDGCPAGSAGVSPSRPLAIPSPSRASTDTKSPVLFGAQTPTAIPIAKHPNPIRNDLIIRQLTHYRRSSSDRTTSTRGSDNRSVQWYGSVHCPRGYPRQRKRRCWSVKTDWARRRRPMNHHHRPWPPASPRLSWPR